MLKQTGKYFLKGFCSLFIVVMLCGFDTTCYSIPIDDICGRGLGKGRVPSILTPKLILAEEPGKTQLKKDDRILGIFTTVRPEHIPLKF
jgi:hypothetical protein